ncbi:MAG: cobalt transporter CbiM [Deltaproteobacteria bacterium]|nr:cobalt transporter CbiM [Deltaproteobacteria bacterium]
MHIPDGYLSPVTYLPAYAVAVPLWVHAFRRVRRLLNEETLPFISALTALSFMIMMLNIPIPGGTSGHAIGTAVIAILFGPWTGFLSVSLVLLIQALLFGDGGITSFPINALTMGCIAAFTAAWLYPFLEKRIRRSVAAFLSGWSSIVLASVGIALALGIQPVIAADSAGKPLFFPFPISVTVPALVGAHMLFFGVAEGIFTVLVLNFVRRIRPEGFPVEVRDEEE